MLTLATLLLAYSAVAAALTQPALAAVAGTTGIGLATGLARRL